MVFNQLVVRNALVRDGAVLLGRRKDAGRWELPGGRVEPDESVAAAGIRETIEETGVALYGEPVLLGCDYSLHLVKPGLGFVEVILGWKEWMFEPKLLEPEKCWGWRWFPLGGTPPPEGLMPSTAHFFEKLTDF